MGGGRGRVMEGGEGCNWGEGERDVTEGRERGMGLRGGREGMEGGNLQFVSVVNCWSPAGA